MRGHFFACLILTACKPPPAEVSVDGPGQVVSAGLICRTRCNVSAATALEAIADEGARFLGWEGACTGDDACTVRPGDSVTARFVANPVLRLRIVGDGTVRASDGRECGDDCTWSLPTPVTLTATANLGAAFMGFSGACNGEAPCNASGGEVTALFATLQEVRVEISGDGGGFVEVGERRCAASCTVTVPTGQSYPVAIQPDVSSVLASLSGACDTQPCVVSPPAVLRVNFARARQVSVTLQGQRRGIVKLNGATFCTNGTCTATVAASQELTLTAETTTDYDAFRGFVGAGCTATPCVVAATTDAVGIVATFESVILWHRTFEANGETIFADNEGIVMAMSAQGSISIDGTTYDTHPIFLNPPFAVLTELNWDAGIKWVAALNHFRPDSGSAPDFALRSTLRVPGSNYILVSGYCAGGRVDDKVACNSSRTPLTISVQDGGLAWLATDLSFGAGNINSRASLSDLTAFDGGVVGFRGGGAFPGQHSASLGWVGDADAGFVAAFTRDELVQEDQRRDCCVVVGGRLRCVFSNLTGLMLDECVLPPPTSNTESSILLEFDEHLYCRWARRLTGSAGYISGPSIEADGGVYVSGLGGPVDFGNGFSVPTQSWWTARWGASGIEQVGTRPFVYSGEYSVGATQTEVYKDELVIHALLGFPQPNITRGSLPWTFVDRQTLSQIKREWVFKSPNPVNSTFHSTRVFVVGDTLAVLVTGVRVSFGDTPLFTTNGVQTHLVVLHP